MASRLQDVIARGLAADRPLATDVAEGTLYHSSDTHVTERSNGTTWENYSDVSSSVSAHHTTHETGGTDAIAALDAAVITTGTISSARLPAVRRQITLVIDGGGSVITTGFKAYVSIPVAGTLKKWRILADLSGSIVIDVWKDVFANYPPVVADTITAAAKPTLSGALSAESSTLTGWNTALVAGDVLGFNVDSVATVKKISLTLEFE